MNVAEIIAEVVAHFQVPRDYCLGGSSFCMRLGIIAEVAAPLTCGSGLCHCLLCVFVNHMKVKTNSCYGGHRCTAENGVLL